MPCLARLLQTIPKYPQYPFQTPFLKVILSMKPEQGPIVDMLDKDITSDGKNVFEITDGKFNMSNVTVQGTSVKRQQAAHIYIF
jgi:hypothetical protein